MQTSERTPSEGLVMGRVSALVSIALCVTLAGCFPVEETIVLQEGKPAQVTCSFALNEAQIDRGQELGLPVSAELARKYFQDRGYRLAPKGFTQQDMTGEGVGFKKFVLKFEATDRVSGSPVNSVVFQKAQSGSNQYTFRYDASVRAVEGLQGKRLKVQPQEADEIGYGDFVLNVQFPGKVLEHSGVSQVVSANSTTVTWRYKIRDLLTDDSVVCAARVLILKESESGGVAQLILAGAAIGLVLGLTQAIRQTRKTAAQDAKQGKATRKRGHLAR